MQPRQINITLLVGLLMLFGLSLLLGKISLWELPQDEWEDFIYLFRLPRTLLAALSGVILGVGGCVFQSYFKNSLVDASLLGVTSLASLGGIVAVALGVPLLYSHGASFFAMFFSGIGFLFLVGGIWRGWRGEQLILIGLSISILAGAMGTLVLNLMPNPYRFFEVLFWLFGSFSEAALLDVFFILPFVISGIFLFFHVKKDLDNLAFGDDMAISLGVNLKRLGIKICFATILSLGSLVSLTGNVGFLGLVVPHMLRPFLGERPSNLLLPSALLGGVLTLFSDILVRLLPTHVELKAGVVIALLGAPFLIFILGRKHV